MDTKSAEILAKSLMREHGATAQGWTFAFDRGLSRFGACHYRTRQITISKHLTELNPIEEVRNTILHEIAHALAGPGVGHGPAWRIIARRIGCTAKRTHNAATPEGRYRGTCPECGVTIYKHRMGKNMRMGALLCLPCHNRGIKSRFVWVENKAA